MIFPLQVETGARRWNGEVREGRRESAGCRLLLRRLISGSLKFNTSRELKIVSRLTRNRSGARVRRAKGRKGKEKKTEKKRRDTEFNNNNPIHRDTHLCSRRRVLPPTGREPEERHHGHSASGQGASFCGYAVAKLPGVSTQRSLALL